ncbi:DGQHR domain-containing protein [Alphaproteobacteria bacterium]|nr:DGQHR domain-containing protein [Alphaproteobacteria bacterium]
MAIRLNNVLKKIIGGRTYYTGYIESKDIYDSVFVPVLKKTKLPKKKGASLALEERDKGYQRQANITRQRNIAKFMIENPSSIIPPVLLSDRGEWKWSQKNGDVGEIVINEKAAVVDGQHRLGGFKILSESDEAAANLPIPFVCVADMDKDEEEKQFLTVNNEQKGLQKQHTAKLRDDLWWNYAAIEFNSNGNFKERIQEGGAKEQWQLDWKLNSVASAIKDCFNVPRNAEDPWGFNGDEERKEHIPDLVSKYWDIVIDVFDEEWSDMDIIPSPFGENFGGDGNTKKFQYKLLEFTGFLVFMKVLKLYSTSFYNRSDFSLKEDMIHKYLYIIKEETKNNPNRNSEESIIPVIDLRKSGEFKYNTGAAGAPVIVKAIQDLISSKI